MNMSDRDRKILTIIVPLVVVLAYWFLLLAPKREAASVAAATLETEQAQLADAQSRASTVRAAKSNFARDYAAVVALGKAIPTSVDMPSLLVQLEAAARGTGIELDGVTMGERETSASAPPTGTAPSGESPESAPGQAAATAEDAADTASTPPATADPTGTAATPSDPGAPAGGALESVSLEFKFKGGFFELADYFHRLKRFVYVKGEHVRVRGRLMTIDGVEYTANADSFPALEATVKATVYLTPKAEGVTAGATPTGPQPAAAPAASASSSPSSPTPTATATP